MSHESHFEGRALSMQGVLLIGTGTALCAFGSLMARPAREQMGYFLATALAFLSLIIAGTFQWMLRNRAVSRSACLAAAVFFAMFCVVLSVIRPTLADVPALGIVAALYGLLWGVRYMKLAFQFQSNPLKALALSALAAATSSAGIILATRSGIGRLTEVALAGCYIIVLGIQVFVTAAFLRLEYAKVRINGR